MSSDDLFTWMPKPQGEYPKKMTEDPNELTPEERSRFPDHENADYDAITEQVRRDREEAANEVVVRLTREEAEGMLQLLEKGLWFYDVTDPPGEYEAADALNDVIVAKVREQLAK